MDGANPYIKHIFSELYEVYDAIREGYLEVKIVELLLTLAHFDVVKDKQKYLSQSQTDYDQKMVEECIQLFCAENLAG